MRPSDYSFSKECLALRDVTRRFVETELRPFEREIERTGAFAAEQQQNLRQKALDAGLFAYNMPEEVGGPGVPVVGQILVREELGKVSIPLADTVGRPPRILLEANPGQRKRFLEPAMRAKAIWAFALTEPEAGSDVFGIHTTARRQDGGFLLRGSKHFISHGAEADFVIVFAKVDDERDLTALVVERGTTGFTARRTEGKMGWRGYELAELTFDDCFVSEENLLGTQGYGLQLALEQINEARLGVAAHCVGMAERALELALDHAKARVQFGRSIGKFQGVQWMLADMATKLAASRALVYEAGRAVDAGGDGAYAISMAKLSASEMANEVIDGALQIFGGAGYMTDLPLERMYRDVRAFRIGEGTSEIQRNLIARMLLRSRS